VFILLSFRFISDFSHFIYTVHYEGPGAQLPGTTEGGYGWDVRTKGLTSALAAEPGQDEGGDGGQPAVATT
jgi:20S proteasome subunit beta 5